MQSNRAAARNLRRRQLDRIVTPVTELRQIPLPRRGWIAEIREALGMSGRQLGHRLGVAPSSVSAFETSERLGGISLNSLRKAAAGLNCQLVYAFVPRESFENVLRDQARAVAKTIVGRVEHSMALEAQGAGAVEHEEAITELADELVRNMDRSLWEPWG
jgi:predicted DNA-binding mobile mystery protein A